MAGPNLEVFKFGMYILFPIGIMYYFGTNLDNKFTVPDFWPRPEQTNKIPYEKEDISAELDRMRHRRLERRQRRLETETRLQELQARTRDAEEASSTPADGAQLQPPRTERRSIMSYFQPHDSKRSW